MQLDWEREGTAFTTGILEALDIKGLRPRVVRDHHGEELEIKE